MRQFWTPYCTRYLSVVTIILFLLHGLVLASPLEVNTSEIQDAPTQDRVERFRIANQYVNEGRPSDAIAIYEELLDTPTGLLYYNSGVAYQIMGKLGLAKAMYLAASHYPETRETALLNLDQIESLLPFKMAKIPRYPWQKVYDVMVDDLGIPFLFGLIGFGLYLFAVGLIGYLFTAYSSPFKLVMIVAMTLLFSIGSVLLNRHFELKHSLIGVVTTSSVTLFEDPDLELESTNIAYEGAVVKVDLRESRPEEGWYFVTLQNGAIGWLMGSSFKTVPLY